MAYRTEIEKLEQRHAENPKQWFAALADAYRKQGDVDLAIEYVQGGIADRPDYASAHIVLGRCYLDKDMDEAAARAFEQVLELDAENIVALKSLEEIAEREGDAGAARQWLTRLLEVDPMNDDAHDRLARLDAEQKAKGEDPEAEDASPTAPAAEAAAEGVDGSEEISADETPPDFTVSEDVVDASSIDVEPMVIEPTMPMYGESVVADDETAAAIEPFEIETPESDASSLLSEVSGHGEFAPADEGAVASIEPIELETDDSAASSLVSRLSGETDAGFVDVADVDSIGSIEPDTVGADASSLLADMPQETESWPDDAEPVAAIEPIELDTVDAAASSLLADVQVGDESFGAFDETVSEVEPVDSIAADADASALQSEEPDEDESPGAFEGTVADVEPIDFESADAGASALYEEEPDAVESVVSFEETVTELEPDEMETAEDDASSPFADMPEEIEIAAEDQAAEEEIEAAVESVETDTLEALDEGIPQRLSVEPTEEIDPADLEALRAADHIVARPTSDDSVVDDAEPEVQAETLEDDGKLTGISTDVGIEEEPDDTVESRDEPAEDLPETPRTREIDAVDLEKLRAADALVAGSTVESLLPDEVEEDAESDDEVEEPVDDGEFKWETEEAIEEREADETEGVDDGSDEAEGAWDDSDGTEVVEQEDDVEDASEAVVHDDNGEDALPLIMPEDVDGGEAATDAEPEPVVTETMAEVYAKQGLLEQAREIYEVLVMQHADDSRLKARLDDLNEQANSAIQETRQSRFSVVVTGGESTVTYLQRIFTYQGAALEEVPATVLAAEAPEATLDSEAEMAPTPLEEAFANDPPEAPGEPTVVAADDVSLASVFDGGVPDPTSNGQSQDGLDLAPDEPGDEEGVSFDEFYGSEPHQSLPDADGSPSDDKPSGDDDNFKDWLKGLKT